MLLLLFQPAPAGTSARMTSSGASACSFDSGVSVRPVPIGGGGGYRRRRPAPLLPPLPDRIELQLEPPKLKRVVSASFGSSGESAATFAAIAHASTSFGMVGDSESTIEAQENAVTFEAAVRRVQEIFGRKVVEIREQRVDAPVYAPPKQPRPVARRVPVPHGVKLIEADLAKRLVGVVLARRVDGVDRTLQLAASHVARLQRAQLAKDVKAATKIDISLFNRDAQKRIDVGVASCIARFLSTTRTQIAGLVASAPEPATGERSARLIARDAVADLFAAIDESRRRGLRENGFRVP